jgi:hypothetical protein
VAYIANKGGRWFVVVGDQKGPAFEAIGSLVFSPDGTNVAYPAKQGGKWFIVVGDKKGPACDDVADPVFSSDGSKMAYGARLQDRELWWKVMDIR